MGHTVPKLLVTFAAGGVGYCALETLWRGRTHPSMALCGGTVLAVAIGVILALFLLSVF